MKKYLYLFIVIAVIVLGILGYIWTLTFMNDVRASRAVTIGHRYITQVYKEYSILGEICQGVDTNGDGYVSCTFRIGKEGVEKEVNLQCPTFVKSFIGNECKATQMILPQ